jgi:hypothetical protein
MSLDGPAAERLESLAGGVHVKAKRLVHGVKKYGTGAGAGGHPFVQLCFRNLGVEAGDLLRLLIDLSAAEGVSLDLPPHPRGDLVDDSARRFDK